MGAFTRKEWKKMRHAATYGCGSKTAYFGLNNEKEPTMKDTELIDTIRIIAENQAEQKTQGISDELNKLKNRMFSVEQEQRRQRVFKCGYRSESEHKYPWTYPEIRGIQSQLNQAINRIAHAHDRSSDEIREIIIQEGMI